jgi:DNA-binding response OmpR family regulator
MGILDNIIGNQPPTPGTSASPSPAKKVLIIEDEKRLADALEIKFRHEGFDVIKADNGQVGLEAIIAQNPHIVLLDLMMPVMDGKTMLKKLREFPQFKNLPVIVLTNAGDVDSMRETQLYYSANAFMIKSNTSPDEIVAKVKDLI